MYICNLNSFLTSFNYVLIIAIIVTYNYMLVYKFILEISFHITYENIRCLRAWPPQTQHTVWCLVQSKCSKEICWFFECVTEETSKQMQELHSIFSFLVNLLQYQIKNITNSTLKENGETSIYICLNSFDIHYCHPALGTCTRPIPKWCESSPRVRSKIH